MRFNMLSSSKICLLVLYFVNFVHKGEAIYCYECDSLSDMTCGETLADGHSHEPSDCSNLQEALYCVKMTGLYEGALGTKRLCSARDFGNYCDMVQRPGDERTYRSCIYTCSEHYCNEAPRMHFPCLNLMLILVILCVVNY